MKSKNFYLFLFYFLEIAKTEKVFVKTLQKYNTQKTMQLILKKEKKSWIFYLVLVQARIDQVLKFFFTHGLLTNSPHHSFHGFPSPLLLLPETFCSPCFAQTLLPLIS